MSHRQVFGSRNRRAQPMVGWQRHLVPVRLLRLARASIDHARHHDGAVSLFPSTLQVQTITGCNASCRICPQRTIRDRFPHVTMSDELFGRIVTQCVGQDRLRGIGFVLQNEPLTDPDLCRRIRSYREQVHTRAMTFIVTNGTLLTPERTHELLSSGLDALHLSCNGLGKTDYEAVNEGKSWDTFEANLEHFLAQDLRHVAVMLSFVRHAQYRDETTEAIARWRARGVPIFVHGINNRGGIVEDYERYAVPRQEESVGDRLRKAAATRLLGCCPYPFLQMSVLAHGEVLLCTHDWGRRTIVGDLRSQTLQGVWNGARMREVRRLLLEGRAHEVPACSGCDVFENATFA